MTVIKFYRVGNKQNEGLWYNKNGKFTGLIHNEFNFCSNSELPMPFDPNIVGYLSVTNNLTDLLYWFSKEDIQQLQKHGFHVLEYTATDYKKYKNHYIINVNSSTIIRQVSIDELP